MQEIKLTQGKVALVDDEDFEWLNQFKWHFTYGYARCYRTDIKKFIRMHRLIINAPDNMSIDHINGNGLDNRKANLRLCLPFQNSANRGKSANNTSGYKGVSFCKDNRLPYRATIVKNNKTINIGSFKTAIEAAKAYDIKALEFWGNFAKLNFSY